jgi:HlyD family secretion protein
MATMKKVLIILVLAGVGLGVWWVWKRSAAPPPAPPPIRTAKVVRGDIELHVEAAGSIESDLDVDVKSKASGEVILLPHDVSDRVPKHVPGQNDEASLLAALDPTDETRNVQRTQAARDAA